MLGFENMRGFFTNFGIVDLQINGWLLSMSLINFVGCFGLCIVMNGGRVVIDTGHITNVFFL